MVDGEPVSAALPRLTFLFVCSNLPCGHFMYLHSWYLGILAFPGRDFISPRLPFFSLRSRQEDVFISNIGASFDWLLSVAAAVLVSNPGLPLVPGAPHLPLHQLPCMEVER